MRTIIQRLERFPLRRLLAAVFAASMVLLSLPATALAEEGSCGAKLEWNLSADGVLRITGSGEMTNFTENSMAPWYEKREEIRSVEIDKKVTSIGNLAFYGCNRLQRVVLPDGIERIGEAAFAGCSSLSRVSLGRNLKMIEKQAFYGCEALQSIRLPENLKTLGYQAFYRCTSLASVTVPASVTKMEDSVFAYCTNLMQASILAPLETLPQWTFYGCLSLKDVVLAETVTEIGNRAFSDCKDLSHVYHGGTSDKRQEVLDQIHTEVPTLGAVTEGSKEDLTSSSSTTTVPDAGGSGTIETDREVIDTGDASIEIKVDHTKPSTGREEIDVTIDATVENEKGWQDLLDKIDNVIRYPERFEDEDTKVGKVEINVNVNGDSTIPSSAIAGLAGYKADLNVSADDNATWTIDCETVNTDRLSKEYDLKFTISKMEKASKDLKKLIGNSVSYVLKFEDDYPFEVTVKVPVGYSYAGHFASVCNKPFLAAWCLAQSVVVDTHGNAHFYLANVEKSSEYVVAIDAPGVNFSNSIIPENMKDAFGELTDATGNRYVLTGVKSSLGITFGQLTLILAGVIVVSAVVVGLVMKLYFQAMNRRNAGYPARRK